MPEKTQVINVSGLEEQDSLGIAFGAIEKLQWTTPYASARSIVALTSSSWKKRSDRVTIQVRPGQVIVTSTMIHDEMFDVRGGNRKNIEVFVGAFRFVGDNASQEDILRWHEALADLKQATLKVAEEEYKVAQEIDRVMNFSKSNLYLTYGIIGVNVLVYLAMAFTTRSVIDFSPTDTLRWGANYGPLTLTGDWWRLLSSVFVHGGLIHIVLNMYALYMAGTYLEPMLGKVRYISAYLCAGVCASLTSLWWHTDPVPSVGASGAIFGLYGLFLAFLTTRFLPNQIRKGLLPSIGVFVAFNLLFGIRSGIDNAAHIGGVISGFIIGYLYYFSMRGERKATVQAIVVVAAVLATTALTYTYLQKNEQSKAVRYGALNSLRLYSSKDGDRFIAAYQQIGVLEDEALSPLRNDSLSAQQLLDSLQNFSRPRWDSAMILASQLKTMNVPDLSKREGELLYSYLKLRKEQADLRIREITANDPSIKDQLDANDARIGEAIARLNGLRAEKP